MSENPFWEYSLVYYSQPEVAQCCLEYQDQYEANVNILLLCCWLGSLGVLIKTKELEQASLTIKPLDLHVVQPLRSVRQYVKTLNSPAGELYSNLKQVELMSEQIVQNDLFNWSMRSGLIADEKFIGENKFISAEVVLAAQMKNLNTYLPLLGCSSVSENSPLCKGHD
jgi:uncharacterized protein (TIGR02444 family)